MPVLAVSVTVPVQKAVSEHRPLTHSGGHLTWEQALGVRQTPTVWLGQMGK